MEETVLKNSEGVVMIKITVEGISWLKDDFNRKSQDSVVLKEVVDPGTSVMDLIHLVASKYPKFGEKVFDDQKQELTDYCLVILNGSIVSASAELNMELKEGDAIKFLPLFFGG